MLLRPKPTITEFMKAANSYTATCHIAHEPGTRPPGHMASRKANQASTEREMQFFVSFRTLDAQWMYDTAHATENPCVSAFFHSNLGVPESLHWAWLVGKRTRHERGRELW